MGPQFEKTTPPHRHQMACYAPVERYFPLFCLKEKRCDDVGNIQSWILRQGSITRRWGNRGGCERDRQLNNASLLLLCLTHFTGRSFR